jgi:hypothetical protein
VLWRSPKLNRDFHALVVSSTDSPVVLDSLDVLD